MKRWRLTEEKVHILTINKDIAVPTMASFLTRSNCTQKLTFALEAVFGRRAEHKKVYSFSNVE